MATQSLVIEGVYLLFKGSRRSGRRRRSRKPSDPDQKHNTLLVVMGGASDVGVRAFVCSRASSVVLPASVWSVWKKCLVVDSIHLNSLTNTRRRTSRIEGDRLKNHIEWSGGGAGGGGSSTRSEREKARLVGGDIHRGLIVRVRVGGQSP